MKIFTPRRLSELVIELREFGELVKSERGPTYEIEDYTFIVPHARDRVCTQSWRKMNIGFAIVDALQHIVGDNRLQPLTQFVPAFSQYSSNGRTIDGAYGERIHLNEQLKYIIDMLQENPSTRRAVLTIYSGPIDLAGGGGLNTPCTLNLHFLVRQGRLRMKVMMRSNDAILGLTNDLFTFTMLHEYVSAQTLIPLGEYSHYASSMHLYENDIAKYREKLEEPEAIWPSLMNRMPDKFDPNPVYNELCRLDKISFENAMGISFNTRYEDSLYFTAAAIFFRKHHDVREMYYNIYDETLKRAADLWLL